jgi:Calx-beta domain
VKRGLIRRVGKGSFIAVLLASVVLAGSPAHAACHAFAISASPDRPREGRTVTVIVSRDAAVAPSMIDVSTVDDTATSGEDYEPLEQTILFTSETSQTFQIAILDDDDAESQERFQLHLSNPGGCDPNPSFVVASDIRVTIRDDDGGAPTTTTPAETTEPATTESVTEAPTPGTPTPTEVAAPEGSDEGLSAGAIAAIAGGLVAIAAVAIVLLRRRGDRGGSDDSPPAESPGDS